MGTEGLLNGHDLVTERRRLVRGHRRRRPGRRPPEPRAVDPEGPRVLHPRRDARLGRRRSRTGSRSSASGRRRRRRRSPTTSRPQRTAEYMRKFADFSHGLSKGMTMGQAEPLPPRLLGRPGRRAAQPGVRRRPLPARRRRGVRHRRQRRRRPLLHRADLQRVGHDDGDPDRTGSLNKAQSEPNADGTWTYVLANADPGRAQLGRPVRAHRGHPHAADGGVPGPAPDRRARRPRAGS